MKLNRGLINTLTKIKENEPANPRTLNQPGRVAYLMNQGLIAYLHPIGYVVSDQGNTILRGNNK